MKSTIFSLMTLIAFSGVAPKSHAASKNCADLFLPTSALSISKTSRALSRPIVNEDNFSYPSYYNMDSQGEVLVTSGYNSKAVRVRRADGTSFEVSKAKDQPHSTVISKDGTFMAVGYGRDNTVELYHLDHSGKTKAKPFASFTWNKKRLHDKPEIRDLAISADGKLVVAVSYVGEGAIFNLETGHISAFDIGEWSNGITFSDDGARIYIGTRREKLFSLSVATGKLSTVTGLKGFNQSASGRLQVLSSGVVVAITPSTAYFIKNDTVVSQLAQGTLMNTLAVDERSGWIFSIGWKGELPFANVHQIDPLTGQLSAPYQLMMDPAYVHAATSTFISRKFGLAGMGVGFNVPVPGDYVHDQLRIQGYHHLLVDDRGRVLLWNLRTGRVFAKLISQQKGREDKTTVQRLFLNEDTGKLVVIHSNGEAYEFDLNGITDIPELANPTAVLQIESKSKR